MSSALSKRKNDGTVDQRMVLVDHARVMAVGLLRDLGDTSASIPISYAAFSTKLIDCEIPLAESKTIVLST